LILSPDVGNVDGTSRVRMAGCGVNSRDTLVPARPTKKKTTDNRLLFMIIHIGTFSGCNQNLGSSMFLAFFGSD
jgi:hypothetical protein